MERRRQLYEDALREVRKDEGTPYPCRQSDLDDYRPSSHVFRPYAPYVSPDQACTDAVHQNTRKRKRSPKEQDAIDRLFGAVIEAEKDWTPDLIIKMFADLDIVFFGGHLRGNVFVKWYKPKSYAKRAMDPQPHSWGCTLFPTPGMAHICLNAKQILVDSIIKSPFRQMWSTMLHEMCHAYDFVRVHMLDQNHQDYHDKYFRTIIHGVHRLSRYIFDMDVIDEIEAEFTAKGTVECAVECVVECLVEGLMEGTVKGIVGNTVVDTVEGMAGDTVESMVDMVERMVGDTVESMVDMVERMVGDTVEGTAVGIKEGMVEGIAEGIAESIAEGLVGDTVESMVGDMVESTVGDMMESTLEGIAVGIVGDMVESTVEGMAEGIAVGMVGDMVESTLEGIAVGMVADMVESTVEGMAEGIAVGMVGDMVESTLEGTLEGMAEGTEVGIVEGMAGNIVESTVDGIAGDMVDGTVDGTMKPGTLPPGIRDKKSSLS
ncbi:hypothetical protein MMC28_006029 [Mycoblastus sanguinarius]|nr:hypothetical protein [Mycoblastus sanguinarius]